MLIKQNLSLSLSKDLISQIDTLKSKLWLSRSEIAENLLKKSIEQELISDAKELSKLDFNDLPSEEEWMFLQSK